MPLLTLCMSRIALESGDTVPMPTCALIEITAIDIMIITVKNLVTVRRGLLITTVEKAMPGLFERWMYGWYPGQHDVCPPNDQDDEDGHHQPE